MRETLFKSIHVGKIKLPIVFLLLAGVGLSAQVASYEHSSKATADGDSLAMAKYAGAAIEDEKWNTPPAEQNIPLADFQTFRDLHEDYENGVHGDIQYLVTPGTNSERYCVLVKHAKGDISKDEGYAYSSLDGSVAPLSESPSCEADAHKMILAAGVKNEISAKSGAEVPNAVVPLILPVAVAIAATTVRSRRKKKEANGVPSARKAEALSSGGDDENWVSEETRDSLHHEMERIILLWSDYEMDPVKVLDYPMVTQMTFAPTASFHRAMSSAKQAFRVNAPLSVLHDAVAELDYCFQTMIAEAQRMRWSGFSAEERRHLRNAQALLNMAMNSASSVHERNIAYKRLLREVEGIITLSPTTILGIEERAVLRIEDR